MDDNVEDCPVCLNTFDDTLRRPRNLPCGHTVCTLCINELKQQGAVTCPTCRASHAVPEAGQFPISYAVEGFLRRLRDAEMASLPAKPEKQAAPAPVTQPAPKVTAGLSRRAQSLLQEQEARVLAAIRSCQEEQSQLADYLTTLGGWGGRQQRLEDELQTLMDQSRSAREVVRGEEARVERRQEQVQRRQQELHAALQALRTTMTQNEVLDVVENADHLVDEQESPGTEECLGVFPDVQAVATVARVAEASRAALQAAAAAAASSTAGAAGGECSLPAACAAASSIADRLQAMLAPPLTAEQLLSLTTPARDLLQAGRVFAVQDVEGRARRARLSLEDGRLHLYSLQDQHQDPTAVTLQMGELLPAAPPCEVFLDLAWPGSAARRVVVRLPRDTPRGRQMVLLCSGQRGACLANTRLHDVWNEGQPGECVEGGDYETGDGKGGAALLPHLGHLDDYQSSFKAGAVWGWWWGDHARRGAQFAINTQDWSEWHGVSAQRGVFGEVVRGLEVVRQAAWHRPITDVTVAECGVLLTQPHYTPAPLTMWPGWDCVEEFPVHIY